MAIDVWKRLYPNTAPTESFIAQFVSNVISKIPDRQVIFESFKYYTTYLTIPMPIFIQNQITKANEMRRQDELLDAQARIEIQSKEQIAQEYISKKQLLIENFLDGTVNELRYYIGLVCDEVIKSISNYSANDISKAHINKIKAMIEKVDILNFYDDKEVETALKGLELEIDKFKGQRNKGLIVEKLKNIVDISKEQFISKDLILPILSV
jgi:hypothetical protein